MMRQVSKNNQLNFRVGFGVDIHQLVEGRDLIIGGIRIESPFGAKGHSDADVLLHAMCDSILGAAALRDIGFHFPNSDVKYKGIESSILLHECYEMVKKEGFVLGNLDATVVLESPHISAHIPEMQKEIANIFKVNANQISIKATTAENLGPIGEGKAIKAYCSAVIFLESSAAQK
jgi:2-C-methyl-D-erythritol 2,4-cyclodiphosphate synthase